MRALSGFVAVALAGAITLAGCGGDSTGPSAASITGIAGDNQEAPTGAPLAFPLSFTALGSGGQPQPGVRVTWTVVSPANGATFAPATSTTDASGTATTIVTLGSTQGEVVIRANVPGVAPVTFHALAVSPCAFRAAYTPGTTASGSLTTADCNVGGFYTDFYDLTLPVGQQSLRINMRSAAFDTYIEMWRLTDELLGADDDSSLNNTNSQLDIIFTGTSGRYYLAPSSFYSGMTGPYTMSAVTRPATLAGCQQVWVTRGVIVTDAIATTDCSDTVGGTHYFEVAWIYLTAGSVLSVAERSAVVNAKLTLYHADSVLTLVASNDDSSTGNTNAFITYSVAVTDPYILLVGTSGPGQTGAYTLDVSASTTLAGATAAGPAWRGPVRLPAVSLRLPKGWPPLPAGRRGH